MSVRCYIAVLLAALSAGCTSLHLEPGSVSDPVWTTEGETNLRDNAVAVRIVPPLEQRWDFNAGAGFGSVSPLIVGDVIFVATRKGEVHAIDVDSGDRVGQGEFGDSIEGTPAYADGTLVVPVAWGGVALRAHSLFLGDRKWTIKGAPVSSGVVIHDEKAIAGDVEGYIRAYALANGDELWSRQLGERSAILSTPVLAGDRLVVANDKGHLAAMHAADGSLEWSVDLKAPVQVTLAANDEIVIAATTRGRIRAVDLATGATRWEHDLQADDVYLTAPAVGEREVVLGASDGFVRSLDVESGSLLWSTNASGAVTASPMITDRVVYVGTMEGKLMALDRESGSVTWETGLDGRIKSAFAASGSRLVVLAEPRVVYLFESGSESYAIREK